MLKAQLQYTSLKSKQISRFERLSELLRLENQTHNLTRITEPEQIRLRHFCDSLAGVNFIRGLEEEKQNCSIIDIGSGAGFPGLALAIALPEINITSVEATGKKIRFQKLAAAELALENFTPIHGRAEELGREPDYREKFDFAVSRAVADLTMLLELCLPFVKVDGYFMAWKTQQCKKEISSAENAVNILGGQFEQQIPYSINEQAPESDLRIVTVKKNKSTPYLYPRRIKAIRQKTL